MLQIKNKVKVNSVNHNGEIYERIIENISKKTEDTIHDKEPFVKFENEERKLKDGSPISERSPMVKRRKKKKEYVNPSKVL